MNGNASPTQQEAQQTPQTPASQQEGAQEQQPYTYGTYAQQVNAQKGDYFSHDNKAYHRRDGKTYLLTGDPMGDVELDADQSAKLDKDLADKATGEKGNKNAMAQGAVQEGFTLDPNGRAPDPGLSVELTPPTHGEVEALAKYVGGPAVATLNIAKGIPDANLNVLKQVGNAVINGGLGYSSGYGATKLLLSGTELPIVPRVTYK